MCITLRYCTKDMNSYSPSRLPSTAVVSGGFTVHRASLNLMYVVGETNGKDGNMSKNGTGKSATC